MFLKIFIKGYETMAKFENFTFRSSNGKATISALKCVPDGSVKGVVQIAHGIAENIDRYREFMEFLASNGYVVAGNDHLGHGKSISADGSDKGQFNDVNGWNGVVEDMVQLHDIMSDEYPDTKYIMFGHSMGSFLTRTYMIDYPDKYDLAIISGTGNQSKLLIAAGNLLANMEVKKNGYAGDGTKLANVAFGSYLKKIDNPRTEYDWLSRDDSVVDKYIADDLCGFTCRSGLYRDMMAGIKYISDFSNISKMNPSKPVYFMSGKEDPVGDYGKGVEKAYKLFCKAGVEDVMIRLYDGGRHEMLNELNKTEVMNDILNWINERV